MEQIINMLETKKEILCEIYESGEYNKTLNYEEICKYINKLGLECEKKFIKKHKSIPINALDSHYSIGFYIWNFCYNEVFIEFYWEESIPFSSGEVKLKYVKNMDEAKLENVRRDVINFFSCPTYGAKNYNEFIKKYGIQYYTG
jgi:hypothetical protein